MMSKSRRTLVSRYSLAAASYCVASLGTTAFWDVLFKDVPFALFFAVLSVTAWFSGFWPGFWVALSGAITTAYLMSSGENIVVAAPLTLFAIATFICYLIEQRSHSQKRLEGVNVLLEAERDQLKAVLQQMPAGVIIVKAPSGELILSNKKVDEILRHEFRTAEGIEQYSHYQGFHADSRAYQADEYPLTRSLMKGEEVVGEEIEYLCGDDQRRIINISSAPIRDRERNVAAALVVFHDLTEHKRLEQQLLQSQRMEAVGRLAGGIAHDFNNLVTVVIGQSQFLLSGLGPNDPRRAQIEEIYRCGERAASLTRQLLAFSRRQVLQPKVLDLNAVVNDVEKMLSRVIGEDVEIAIQLGPALGRVKADPGQIEQIIINLAVNARDAMPQGGRLTIETANVNLDDLYASQHLEVRPGPHVLLAVTDNGIGMNKETQSQIFEPFFTTKERGKVYSEPGRGTTQGVPAEGRRGSGGPKALVCGPPIGDGI